VGQNYRESATWASLEKQENGINLPSGTETDRRKKHVRKISFDFRHCKDRLLLNYDLTQNNNNSTTWERTWFHNQ
jgi:hypothetical protein